MNKDKIKDYTKSIIEVGCLFGGYLYLPYTFMIFAILVLIWAAICDLPEEYDKFMQKKMKERYGDGEGYDQWRGINQ